MHLRSRSFETGKALSATYAMGAPDGFGGNRNPQLAWRDAPAATRSFALLCVDPDAPTDPSLVGKPDVDIPVEHPRGDFVHWVVADIPADVHEIAEGACSDGVVRGGKSDPPGLPGARQGVNDYTGWFAGDAELRGRYRGYDGPYPPANDLRTHRYFFRLFALDVDALELPPDFGAAELHRAMLGHVLAEALVYGTYSLKPGVSGEE